MALRWVFDAETSKFSKGLDKMRTEAKAATKNIGQHFKALGGVIGGAILGGGMAQFANDAERIVKAAQRLGTSPRFIRQLEALSLHGMDVDLDGMIEFMQDLNEKSIEAASGADDLVTAFKSIGINADEIARKDLEGMYREFADAIKNADDHQAALAATMKIGSDEATKMITIFKKGSEELDRMTESMEGFKESSLTATAAQSMAAKQAVHDARNTGVDALGAFALGAEGVAKGVWKVLSNPAISPLENKANFVRGFDEPFNRVARDVTRRERESREAFNSRQRELERRAEEVAALKRQKENQQRIEGQSQIEGESAMAIAKAFQQKEQDLIELEKAKSDLLKFRAEAARMDARRAQDAEAAWREQQGTGPGVNPRAPSLPVTTLRSIGGGSLSGMGQVRSHLRELGFLQMIASSNERIAQAIETKDGTKTTAKPRG